MSLKKVCTKCWQEKELDEFYVDKSAKEGYTSSCKKCIRETQNREWRLKRRKVMEAIGNLSGLGIQCTECETWYDRADVFEIHARSSMGKHYLDTLTHAQLYNHILKHKRDAVADFRLVCKNCSVIKRTTPDLTKSQQPNGE